MLLCSKMLTRFWGDRKWPLAIWKATPTMTSPRTTGRTPLSPPLTLCHQMCRYSPIDWARISVGASPTAAAAVRSTVASAASIKEGAATGPVSGSLSIRAITHPDMFRQIQILRHGSRSPSWPRAATGRRRERQAAGPLLAGCIRVGSTATPGSSARPRRRCRR